MTGNNTENRKRWSVDKFDDIDVERHYQQEIQQKLQRKPPSNDKGEEWMCIKETLITSAQDIIGEKQHEINEEWYDQECREIVEVKREARLKCIQHSTTANQQDYNKKRIAASRVCRRKKRELLNNKVDKIVQHHTKN
jgi:hypothetical protein